MDSCRVEIGGTSPGRRFQCFGGVLAEARLKEALARSPLTAIRSLHRAPEEPDASCWLAGDGWWLSNAPVSESSLAGSRDGQRPLKGI